MLDTGNRERGRIVQRFDRTPDHRAPLDRRVQHVRQCCIEAEHGCARGHVESVDQVHRLADVTIIGRILESYLLGHLDLSGGSDEFAV